MDDFKSLNDELKAFPEKIYGATQITEEAREAYLIAEARKDYEAAKAFLTAKSIGLTVAESERKAITENFATVCEVIRIESAYRRAQADQIRLENEFTSIRKRANLFEASLQRIGDGA